MNRLLRLFFRLNFVHLPLSFARFLRIGTLELRSIGSDQVALNCEIQYDGYKGKHGASQYSGERKVQGSYASDCIGTFLLPASSLPQLIGLNTEKPSSADLRS